MYDIISHIPKRTKLIAIGTILSILIISSFFLMHDSILSASIDIAVAPSDSKITLDNKKISNNEQIRLAPGDHQLIIQRDGFTTETINFSIEKNEQLYFPVELTSNSPETANFFTENPSDLSSLEGVAGRQHDEIVTQENEKYPILAVLPRITSTFRIDFGVCTLGSSDFCLFITAKAGLRNRAMLEIYDLGFDPADYYIKFLDYHNPFMGEG